MPSCHVAGMVWK